MECFPARGKQALAGARVAALCTFTKRLCPAPKFISKLNAPAPYLARLNAVKDQRMIAANFSLGSLLRRATEPGGSRHGPCDARIARALAEFRNHGHRAVRLLDLDCADGGRLLRAAARARELGFVAIEGHGVSLWTAGIRHAGWQAGLATHLSTSLTFEIAEPIAALAAEHDGAADLILLSEPMPYPASPLAAALARIGGTVLAGG
jgi:hypothetical protein